MSSWTAEERQVLEPVVDAIVHDLEPLAGKRILVLCSAAGEVAFRIGERVGEGEVIGLELADDMLEASVEALADRRDIPARFQKALTERIPFLDESFDGVVSEFIVFPTSQATDIGQPEMARVLRPGGVVTITDVIVPAEPPPEVRADLSAAGLDYLCAATLEDFRRWRQEAGLTDVEVLDLTDVVRPVWERRLSDPSVASAARHLLGSGPWSLGHGLRYIRVRGTKPTSTPNRPGRGV